MSSSPRSASKGMKKTSKCKYKRDSRGLLIPLITLLALTFALVSQSWMPSIENETTIEVVLEESFEVPVHYAPYTIDYDGEYVYVKADYGATLMQISDEGETIGYIGSVISSGEEGVKKVMDLEPGKETFAYTTADEVVIVGKDDLEQYKRIKLASEGELIWGITYSNGYYYISGYDKKNDMGLIFIVDEKGEVIKRIEFKPVEEVIRYALPIEVYGEYAYWVMYNPEGPIINNITVVDLKSGNVVGYLLNNPRKNVKPDNKLLIDSVNEVIDVSDLTHPFDVDIASMEGEALYASAYSHPATQVT